MRKIKNKKNNKTIKKKKGGPGRVAIAWDPGQPGCLGC